MSNPRAVRIRGPLATYVGGFCDELAGQGYAVASAGVQLQLMAHVSRWLEDRGLGVGDLTPERVDEFFWDRRSEGYRSCVSSRSLVAMTGYLARLGVLGPFPKAVVTQSPKPSQLSPAARAINARWGHLRRRCWTMDQACDQHFFESERRESNPRSQLGKGLSHPPPTRCFARSSRSAAI